MSIQGRRKGLDSHQLLRRKESLERTFNYFEDKYRMVPLIELRSNLKMSPNVLHRNLRILVEDRELIEHKSENAESRKGRRRFFTSYDNFSGVQHLQDLKNLHKQYKQKRTKLVYEDLLNMIRLAETTMTKNKTAKMFGLKSGKSFERLIRKYPSLIRFRENYRKREDIIGWMGTMYGPYT